MAVGSFWTSSFVILLNDVRNHLIYFESSSYVETGIINGEIMVEEASFLVWMQQPYSMNYMI